MTKRYTDAQKEKLIKKFDELVGNGETQKEAAKKCGTTAMSIQTWKGKTKLKVYKGKEKKTRKSILGVGKVHDMDVIGTLAGRISQKTLRQVIKELRS